MGCDPGPPRPSEDGTRETELESAAGLQLNMKAAAG